MQTPRANQPAPPPRRVPRPQPGDRRGPWQVLATRDIYQNPWMRVREDRVIRPDGNPGIYGVVEFTPAVAVVAVDDEARVYLVGQYRYATDGYSWEIVTGYADGDDDEDLLVAAQRELLEETGLAARKWTPLGTCHISNSVTDQIGYLYLAQELVQGTAQPDATEELVLRMASLDEAFQMAQASEIVQAFSLVGLYRAWNLLRGG